MRCLAQCRKMWSRCTVVLSIETPQRQELITMSMRISPAAIRVAAAAGLASAALAAGLATPAQAMLPDPNLQPGTVPASNAVVVQAPAPSGGIQYGPLAGGAAAALLLAGAGFLVARPRRTGRSSAPS